MIVALTILSTMASAKIKIAEGINLDAEFRPRFELDNRDFNNATGYDAYSTYRTRIGLELDGLIEKTVLYIKIGDSRTMGYGDPYLIGNPVGPNRFDNNLGVIEAFIEVHDVITPGFYLKTGRMSNNQGRFRLFGSGNWNFFGPRTYDGIKIGYIEDAFSLNMWHFFGANGDRHWYSLPDDPAKYPDPDEDYKRDHTLTGIDLTLLSGKINLLTYLDLDQEPVVDTLNNTSNVAVSRMTTALYAHENLGSQQQHRFDLDLAYQFGTMGHTAGQADISAYLLAGDWSWRFEECLKSWIGLGFHILSGDDGEDPGKVNYFYDKYCSKHRVLGYMDYFKSDTGVKSLGIRDLILRGGFSPAKGLKCQMDAHYFAVEKAFSSSVDGSDADVLGQELDITIKYAIRKGLQCQLGLNLFLPTEDWQGSETDTATLCYLILTAKI